MHRYGRRAMREVAMTVEQAVALLHGRTNWRCSSVGEQEQLTKAIDVLCDVAERLLETAKNGLPDR